MEKKYIISESDLRRLLISDAKLIALLDGGVDNWEYCGEALCFFLDRYGLEDYKEYADGVMKEYSPYELTHVNDKGLYLCAAEVL